MRKQVDGIEIVPSFDGKQSHVFVQLESISLNGSMFQSQALTLGDVDKLIDQLIDACAEALAMAKR